MARACPGWSGEGATPTRPRPPHRQPKQRRNQFTQRPFPAWKTRPNSSGPTAPAFCRSPDSRQIGTPKPRASCGVAPSDSDGPRSRWSADAPGLKNRSGMTSGSPASTWPQAKPSGTIPNAPVFPNGKAVTGRARHPPFKTAESMPWAGPESCSASTRQRGGSCGGVRCLKKTGYPTSSGARVHRR